MPKLSELTDYTTPAETVPEKGVLAKVTDKLFGLNGQERYQLWPEKMVRDAVTAIPTVSQPNPYPEGSEENYWFEDERQKAMIPAALNMAALAGTGGFAGTGKGGMALGSGPIKPNLSKLDRQSLEKMGIDDLDLAAWGNKQGDILTVDPKNLNVKYKDDLVNPQDKFNKQGMKWANSVDFSEPIQISIGKDGKYYIEDGHHRYFAASKLNKPIQAEVSKIEGNAINKILGVSEAEYKFKPVDHEPEF